jgi:hypothetical protein
LVKNDNALMVLQDTKHLSLRLAERIGFLTKSAWSPKTFPGYENIGTLVFELEENVESLANPLTEMKRRPVVDIDMTFAQPIMQQIRELISLYDERLSEGIWGIKDHLDATLKNLEKPDTILTRDVLTQQYSSHMYYLSSLERLSLMGTKRERSLFATIHSEFEKRHQGFFTAAHSRLHRVEVFKVDGLLRELSKAANDFIATHYTGGANQAIKVAMKRTKQACMDLDSFSLKFTLAFLVLPSSPVGYMSVLKNVERNCDFMGWFKEDALSLQDYMILTRLSFT